MHSTDVVFVGDEALNLDAANLRVLDLYSDIEVDFFEEEDVFYDCQFSSVIFDKEDLEPEVVHQCSTIFDVGAMSSSSVEEFSTEVEACKTIKKNEKESLHIPIHVCGHCIYALVDCCRRPKMVGPLSTARIVDVCFRVLVRTCCVPTTQSRQTSTVDVNSTGFLPATMVGYDHTKRDDECDGTDCVQTDRCSHLLDANG